MRKLLPLLLLSLLAGCDDPVARPEPDSLLRIGGDGQRGEVSQLLADSLVVRVEARGRGVADVPVRWTLEGDGSVGDLSAFETPTDANGRAAVVWRLGPLAGEQRVTAAVAGLPAVAFSATGLPGRAASLVVEPSELAFTAIGDTARLSVRSVDAFGNEIDEDPRVFWEPLYDGVVSVDAAGLVTALGDGATPIEARLGSAVGGATATVRLPVAELEIAQRNVVALTGDTVALVLEARSAAGDTLFRDIAQWTTSDPAVATIDSTGHLVAHAEGVVALTATIDGVSDTVTARIHVGSGHRVPELAHIDSLVPKLLADSIPGAAVAVVRDGRLVLARGYGYADPAAGDVVQPESLFRVASISKTVTAAAVMRLVEQGRLELDDRAFLFLDSLQAPAGEDADHRLDNITVQQLLEHSGGWDAEDAISPMFASRAIARALGIESPPGVRDIIRYMRGQPLQFTPGAKHVYSNFGYAVLGRVIEAVTGQAYEEFVRQEVFAPAGITDALLARTRLEDRAEGEVKYFYPGTSASVFPPYEGVEPPYGGFYIEAMDSHGGWVLSAIDLVRLMSALDGSASRPDVVAASSLELMTRRPALRTWNGTPSWYGLGLWVQEQLEGTSWWHDGSLPGTTALVVRSFDERTIFALVMNGTVFPGRPLNAMWEAVLATATWPTLDLFSVYR